MKQLCQQYLDKGIMCPRNIEKGLVTTAAINNIDHDHLLLQLNVCFMKQVYHCIK